MKKIFILFLFPVFANGQALENIKIANFSLQARDIETVTSNLLAGSEDQFEMFQRFRIAYRNSPPATPTTIVTADTVTAQALLELYRFSCNEPTYVTDANNKRIINAIKAVVNTPLQNAITVYESELLSYIQARRDFGRRKLSGFK